LECKITSLAAEADKQAHVTGSTGSREKVNDATLAADMAAVWELWHTPGKDGYATIEVNGHNEHWPIRGQTFKRFVSKRFFEENARAITSEALSAAINLMEAQAVFDGEEHRVHVRIAEHEGAIYLDLCNSSWQVVQITRDGWLVTDDAPVRFRRSKSMLALPAPAPGGSVDLLRAFLNVDHITWILVIAWLVAAFRPRGPYPVLSLFAEQGSGKITSSAYVREPCVPDLPH